MRFYKYFYVAILYSTFILTNQLTLQGQTASNNITTKSDITTQSNTSPEIIVDEATLKSYAGRYDYGQGMVLLVTLEDNKLNAQLTGQPKFPIYPTSRDEFIWKVVEARVKFVTDEKGIVTHAIHNQNGTRIEAKRLQDQAPVKVDPAVFDKYVGKYDVGGNFIIEVTKDGDKLMAQGTNLPKYQLLPSSEIDYYALEISVKLTFQLTDGKVTSMLLSFNGAEKAAMRIIE